MNFLNPLVSPFLHDPLSFLAQLGLCIGVSYIFMRGLLGVFYEVASRVVKKPDGPENSDNEQALRKRAENIRNASRTFERTFGQNCGFPVVLDKAETCQVCNKESFVVVHPDMICDSCWLAVMRPFSEGLRALKEGTPLEEVLASVHERWANDPAFQQKN